MLKLSLPVKPANLDYGVVYSCSAAPEPVHAAHTIKCHITWNLELCLVLRAICKHKRMWRLA